MEMYFVGKILTRTGMTVTDKEANYSREFNVDMCWAHGMIGVCPIFKDYESAKRHSPDTEPIQIDVQEDGSVMIIGEG